MPVYTHEVASDILDFHFELYSDLPYVTSATANTATITLGQYGGALFTNDSVGVFLGTTQLNSATNVLKVTNTGNFQTGLIFTLSSPVPSLTITNVTNGTKYTLPSPLYNLSYDSTTRPSTVISNGTDYSGYRAVGSTTVTLSPGDNYIRFGADASADWTGYADPATITASLSWYNAYINS